MLLFCPRGHNQTNLSAMGGLCEICLKIYPEEFACKDIECSSNDGSQHFHPTEDNYFIDINGNKF